MIVGVKRDRTAFLQIFPFMEMLVYFLEGVE